MSIFDQEKQLFENWSANRVEFVKDGAVDESSYLNSPIFLCFVMKEINGKKDESWDLRDFLRKGGRAQTWDNISRWTHGIHKLPLEDKWSQYSSISNEFRIKQLRKIVAFNLKKSSGSHTTKINELNNASSDDREWIKRQFQIYNADITICCGTGSQLKMALGLDQIDWEVTSRGVNYLEYAPRKYIIDFSHPAARTKCSFLHYSLLDAVREIYL
ncbi:hypothetical protein [Aliivibrio fischeri]|uniref:hypothetical protein n=1 Tax=Aliivibrio fischeri TaxID=668 RepID=UPI003736395A